MDVLVTGATGFVGSRLVRVLVELGQNVHVLTRDASRYDGPEIVTVHEGDVLEPETIREAVAAVDVAYYLVHSMHVGASFESMDRQAAESFAKVATEEELDEIVYLGGLGEEKTELSPHLESRREVETLLGESEASLTVLRAAVIIGDGSASFDLVCDLVRKLPVMVVPRWVETPCQPIAIQDVVAYLAGVLYVDGVCGNTFEIGGDDVVSYRVLLKAVAERESRFLFIQPVPVLTPKLSSYWVGLMSDVPSEVAKPLILGLDTPVVVDDMRIQSLIPITPTPLDEAIEAAIDDSGFDADDVVLRLQVAGVVS